MPRSPVLHTWVVARLPVVIGAALLGRRWVEETGVGLLTAHPAAHSAIKGALLSWQTALLRGPALFIEIPVGAALCVVLSRLGQRGAPRSARTALTLTFCALTVGGIVAASHSPAGIGIGVAALTLEALPAAWLGGRAWRMVAAIPGTEVVLFRPVAYALLGRSGARDGVLAAIGGALAVSLWFVGDIVFDVHTAEELARWPDSRVDARVTVLDRVAPPSVFDFQDIDRVGDHLVVIGESPPRLIAYPLDGGPSAAFPLRPFWANNTGMAVESTSDPATGRTWFLAGPSTLGQARYADGAWTSGGETPPFARMLLHGAMEWFPETQTVTMVTLNVSETRDAPQLVSLHVNAAGVLAAPEIRRLRTADGQPLPVIRDAVWVPPLHRFVLAPDFGSELYLADPRTGIGAPWLPISTLNGRLVWDDALGRLFIARPERAEIAIVDPVRGVVERTLHTAPGVRALAVDAKRGLILTGSVVTGAVDVLSLTDGERVDRYTGFMPMVRNLQLIPERGEAVLSTWAVLYRFPYATPDPAL